MRGSERNGPAPAGRRSKPAVVRRRAQPRAGWPWILAIIIVFPFLAEAAEVESSSPGGTVYQSNNLAIGVGFGIVKFDSKVKVRDKKTGGRRFLDLEGNLDLPETDRVDIVYGAYNFNARHSLVFSYFAIKRDSLLQDFEANYDDIILLRATIEVEDKSSFFDLGYGYNLFRDDRSSVTAVAGVNFLDLKLVTTASGNLTVDGVTTSQVEIAEADVLAPLPLVGLNFSFDFTPEWGISTRITLVDGTYEGISATAWHTTINSVYQLSPRTGIMFGITHFDISVEVNDDDEITDVQYGYSGLFAGMHFVF